MFTKRKEKEETIPPFVPQGPTSSTPPVRKQSDEQTASPVSGPTFTKGTMDPLGRQPSRPLRREANSTTSTMNPHLNFQGDLKYAGSLTVDCEFGGTITTDDTLVVGPSAKVEAELRAGVVEIHGKVHGDVHAKTRVKIYTGGEVCGNIETPTISMEEGVVFEGQCTRPQSSQSPSSPAPAPAPTSVQRVLEGAAPAGRDAEETA